MSLRSCMSCVSREGVVEGSYPKGRGQGDGKCICQSRAAQEAAMHNVPQVKMEQTEFHDAHEMLGDACRGDPLDVDLDAASLD